MKEIYLSDAELDAAMQQLEDSIALKPPASAKAHTTDDELIKGMHIGGSFGCMNNSHAVDILRALYPDTNWNWFLVRNRAGLTEGYPKIQFDQNCEEVVYELIDIEDFAEMYGEGKYSRDLIRKVACKVFESIPEPEYREVEMRGDTEEDVIGVRSEGDADALCLSREQAVNLSYAIEEAAEIQRAAAYAVTTFTYALRAAAEAGQTLDKKELEAFVSNAIEVAGRSYDNAENLFELRVAVNRRIGDGYIDNVSAD